MTAQTKVFGADLDTLVQRQKKDVPLVVIHTLDYLNNKNAHLEEGLFRIPGNTVKLAALKKIYDTEPNVDLYKQKDLDLHTVACLLKMYLRELPTPVIIPRYYSTYLKVYQNPDPKTRLLNFRKLVMGLPKSHSFLLLTVLEYLHRVAANQAINKMTTLNLALIFAPNLMRAEKETLTSIMEDADKVAGTLQFLIQEIDYLTTGNPPAWFESPGRAKSISTPVIPNRTPSISLPPPVEQKSNEAAVLKESVGHLPLKDGSDPKIEPGGGGRPAALTAPPLSLSLDLESLEAQVGDNPHQNTTTGLEKDSGSGEEDHPRARTPAPLAESINGEFAKMITKSVEDAVNTLEQVTEELLQNFPDFIDSPTTTTQTTVVDEPAGGPEREPEIVPRSPKNEGYRKSYEVPKSPSITDFNRSESGSMNGGNQDNNNNNSEGKKAGHLRGKLSEGVRPALVSSAGSTGNDAFYARNKSRSFSFSRSQSDTSLDSLNSHPDEKLIAKSVRNMKALRASNDFTNGVSAGGILSKFSFCVDF